jgi:hypothetical protein
MNKKQVDIGSKACRFFSRADWETNPMRWG